MNTTVMAIFLLSKLAKRVFVDKGLKSNQKPHLNSKVCTNCYEYTKKETKHCTNCGAKL